VEKNPRDLLAEAMKKIFLPVLSFLMLTALTAHAYDGPRFFLEGDGTLKLAAGKYGKGGTFIYRDAKNGYDLPTLDKINLAFGMKTAPTSSSTRA
jgi:hypothetical protein